MGACPWKYALGKPGEGACQSYVGSCHKYAWYTGLGVVLALAIRHRVAFRVYNCSMYFNFCLGCSCTGGSSPDRSEVSGLGLLLRSVGLEIW
jgi:hypothetical protein